MKKFNNLLWGVVLVLIGLIVGGNSLGIINVNIFFTGWWTLFIIVPCFIGLFQESKTGSIIGLLIGVGLLLACRDIINFDLIWKLLFPIILVIVGVGIIFRDTFRKKITKETKELNKNNDNIKSIFTLEKVKFAKEKFTGTNLETVFGGIEYDLKNALIESDVIINANAIFGGIKIYVPENVEVKIKATSIFGGVENKVINEKKKSYTLYINGMALFGGIEIK